MIGIVESAGRLRRAQRREARLFEVLGRWVPRIEEPSSKLLVARCARHHAEHARGWEALVPVLHDVPVAAPAPDGIDDALDALAGLSGADPAAVARYGELLDALLADARCWLDECVPAVDAPVLRALRAVIADEDGLRAELDEVSVS